MESPIRKNIGFVCSSCRNEKVRIKYNDTIEIQRKRGRDKHQKFKSKYNAKIKLLREKQKNEIYSYYGSFCKCCGETITKFLTIDHVNNDGNKHRKQVYGKVIGGKSWSVYAFIVKNNFPDDFQILCYNCNCGRARNKGICPHKE